ncbi:MAG TPA: acetate uptake transporter [Methanobacterium sp.]|nr:acetate uptake transporter [Methanobacterium sp.]
MAEDEFATITIDGKKLSTHTPANPAPLGFIAVGLTIVFYGLFFAGLYGLNSMIFTLGIVYGGITLLIASAMEYKNGNTFGTVAFGLYGIYWISDILILIFAKLGWGIAPDTNSIAIFYFVWGLFTVGIFIGTLKLSRIVQAFFLTLAVLFFLLTAWVLTGNTTLALIAGWEGVLCGVIGVYIGLAEVLNDLYDSKVLPV